MSVLKASNDAANPVDQHYEALECDLKPMEKSSKMYKVCFNID